MLLRNGYLRIRDSATYTIKRRHQYQQFGEKGHQTSDKNACLLKLHPLSQYKPTDILFLDYLWQQWDGYVTINRQRFGKSSMTIRKSLVCKATIPHLRSTPTSIEEVEHNSWPYLNQSRGNSSGILRITPYAQRVSEKGKTSHFYRSRFAPSLLINWQPIYEVTEKWCCNLMTKEMSIWSRFTSSRLSHFTYWNSKTGHFLDSSFDSTHTREDKSKSARKHHLKSNG